MKCPAFFKFFVPEFSHIVMKIPRAFTKQVGDKGLPKKVWFTDRNDNMWIVKVANVGDDRYFDDGWDKFAKESLLESGDLLVFEYFIKGFFNVKIYGPSAIEKKGVVATGSIDVEEDVHENSDNELNSDDDDNNHNEVEETESDHIFMGRGNEFDGDDEDDDDDYEESEDNYAERDQENERETEDNHDQETEDKSPERDHETKRRVIGTELIRSRGRPSADSIAQRYGVDIFKAGLAEQPQNPYFVTKIMEKRKGDLFIPKDIINDNNLDFAQEAWFVDPRGRKFRAKCKIWKDGRVVISGGWRKLCNVNFVETDDRCICEFVEGEDGVLFINVSIVHADALKG